MIKPGYQQPHRPQKLRCNTRLLRRIAKLLHRLCLSLPKGGRKASTIAKGRKHHDGAHSRRSGTTDESLLVASQKAKRNHCRGAYHTSAKKYRIRAFDHSKPSACTMCLRHRYRKMKQLVVDKKQQTQRSDHASFLVGTTEYAVPLGNSIDVEAEIKKLEMN